MWIEVAQDQIIFRENLPHRGFGPLRDAKVRFDTKPKSVMQQKPHKAPSYSPVWRAATSAPTQVCEAGGSSLSSIQTCAC